MLIDLSVQTKRPHRDFKKSLKKRYVAGLSVFGLVAVGLTLSPAMLLLSPTVYADRFEDQINSLNQQNSDKKVDIGQLGSQASSLQDAVTKLQAEIANLQTQLVVNEAKRVETMAKIAEAEAELLREKVTLADNVKSMYVKGQMSRLEELATSKDLSAFADQAQYRVSVQNDIQETLTAINDLKTKLAGEKTGLERMIIDLQDMSAKVASQQAEQSRLLALNQSQRAELDSQIKVNNSKAGDLRQQQATENARLFESSSNRNPGVIPKGVAGGGGYPGRWAFAPIDSLVDSWGMYNRQCVSWTAFKVAASGRYMPYWGGIGNAKQWDDNARAAGIPVDKAPRLGDVAVSNAGTWGHVMYVEQVADDGSIYVSDYNQQFDGIYRKYWIGADRVSDNNLVFIHF